MNPETSGVPQGFVCLEVNLAVFGLNKRLADTYNVPGTHLNIQQKTHTELIIYES